MSAKKKNEVVNVIKIKPYPITASLFTSETQPPLSMSILRLTDVGFQAEVANTFFKVGVIYKVDFTIPYSNHRITEQVKVVKTMDRYLDDKATIKGYLVEMHFIKLNLQNTKAIKKFTVDINQKL